MKASIETNAEGKKFDERQTAKDAGLKKQTLSGPMEMSQSKKGQKRTEAPANAISIQSCHIGGLE